jgi:hypothetical protein
MATPARAASPASTEPHSDIPAGRRRRLPKPAPGSTRGMAPRPGCHNPGPMSPLPSARTLRRLALALPMLGVALALTGCEQVAIIKSTTVAAHFDPAHGNNPVAANDAQLIEQGLAKQGQIWTIRLDTQPAGSEDVPLTNQQAVVAARGKVSQLVLTLTANNQSTVDAISARGAQVEQSYGEALVQNLASGGYTHMTHIKVELYYHASHHATLSWQSSTGFVFKILDGQP